MIRYLLLIEVIELHRQIIEQSGGALGIRDLGAVESALAQPRMTFGGEELYPTLVDKAAAMGFSLIMNHPFIDGNKRIGHGAMEVFLVMNGLEINASIDEQEEIILSLASGKFDREAFTQWLKSHVKLI
ncbi:type II toxin-antitoxin system death-on-curing family toxin [Anabaenopsis tanganyikae CS-531]|uniref:Type II toxin-antitoxin system death-on-curing family toxin n=2 Tax=Anabaenopsis TaxID=110103 RepID=A0ABT5AW79_9CYAN|nr:MULTISPECIES: type II toxin-antitoxin system death-on-curing family toxin [Anabaenopsis]MDB9540952.1 type II toxin-antitoxin system death-on-curing family toxin [Anabaenopsis arnoldii]MDH6093389.1 type II toxin-antitoxin system death-on-curing family toxin [Anabaenopsis arnoldii]MDH6106445.1 type II toxin-antitoxin system death-on-curing family toxin [Anabaenopsis tanganyikae CS-531]